MNRYLTTTQNADPMIENSKMLPLVSVGLLAYNADKYIAQTLESLLSQDYPNFEVTISDNASEDDTQRICLHHASRHPHIRYLRNATNLGALKNFEGVVARAQGKYFMLA